MAKSTQQLDVPATNLVIFGVTGDLSRRYILPALVELDEAGQLPSKFQLIGLSRQALKVADVLDQKTQKLAKYLKIMQMDVQEPADYLKLKKALNPGHQTIFYLSVPPMAVRPILKQLSGAGLNKGDSKLLMEKPFGFDLESARELVSETMQCFSEEQVYRIDHFMAKEMAQNISVFLGSNALFRNVWNNQSIESIEVLAAEQISIEGRVNFYEQTGALRDVLQNHLMNLAALTVMRPCSSQSEFEQMPQRRLEALKFIKPADPKQAFRGQYAGYRQEVSNPHSMVETFASVRLASSDPRWRGVPIHLVTGKSLDAKCTQIKVNFKKSDEAQANSLVLRIQPAEGVEIDLWAKKPGFGDELRRLPLKFDYAADHRLPDAYERVLIDAMRSRASLFATSSEVLETWRILQPVIDAWAASKKMPLYKPGSSVEQVIDKAV